MKKNHSLSRLNLKRDAIRLGAMLSGGIMMTVQTLAGTYNDGTGSNLEPVAEPIVDLINSVMGPLMAVVLAVASLYCIILGVKYAKAEEPQEREKAKVHLKNAILGFVIIFVLILALNLLTPIMARWVNANIDSKSPIFGAVITGNLAG